MTKQKYCIGMGLIALLCILLGACQSGPLLDQATMEPALLTPNGDGQSERARLTFRLRRDADVSITLEDAVGMTYTLRALTPIAGRAQPYTLEFKGIVEGYVLPDEDLDYEVLTRMLPDGLYTWRIAAQTPSGAATELTGTVTIRDAETLLPGLENIEIEPATITPNQDGIEDVGAVRLRLAKAVETLSVYLLDHDGTRYPLYEAQGETLPNAKGPHTFVYDSLVHPGRTPGDGTYPVILEAQDSLGQLVRAERSVALADAGRLYGYIDLAQVEYSTTTVALSETLCFTLTVVNAGETHIRTTGPWPGTTYPASQNFTTLGWPEDEGVFRVALDREYSKSAYPYRWGIGTPGVDLVQRDGEWVLPPGERGTVRGCVRIDELPPENPIDFWLGLMHEQGKLPLVNHRVAPITLTVTSP